MVAAPMPWHGVMEEIPKDVMPMMLAELSEQFWNPAFQIKAKSLEAQALSVGCSPISVLAHLELQVKIQVFEQCGLPPDFRVVALMRPDVFRRVWTGEEGTFALYCELMKILNFEPRLSVQPLAKHVFSEHAATTSTGYLKALCSGRLATANASIGSSVSALSVALIDRLIDEGTSYPVVMALTNMALAGVRAASLSGDQAMGTSVPVLDAPSPEDFFSEFVLRSRPAVLRKVVDSGSFPPLQTFPDFGYLRSRCGTNTVDHSNQTLLADVLTSIEAFENGDDVDHDSWGFAWVSGMFTEQVDLEDDLPELIKDIWDADSDPHRAYANCFGPLIDHGVHMYLCCGKITKGTHYHTYDSLFLCVCGTSRWWLYPPSDARFLYPVGDFTRSAVLPFYRLGDLPQKFQGEYGQIADAHRIEVTLRPGDILYLPMCWWQCIEGSKDRCVILAWGMRPHPERAILAATEGDADALVD